MNPKDLNTYMHTNIQIVHIGYEIYIKITVWCMNITTKDVILLEGQNSIRQNR